MDTYQDLINKAEDVRSLLNDIQVLFLFSNERKAINSNKHDKLLEVVTEFKGMVDTLRAPETPGEEE